MATSIAQGEVSPDAQAIASTVVSLESRLSLGESSISANSAITSLVTVVSANLSTDTSAAVSLTSRVSSDETNNTSTALSLTTRVSLEESNRLSGVTSLATSVSGEASSRTSGDLSLTTRVSTEESTRASADASGGTRMSTDETAATSLQTRVSTEESSRTSAALSLTTRASTDESSVNWVVGTPLTDTATTTVQRGGVRTSFLLAGTMSQGETITLGTLGALLNDIIRIVRTSVSAQTATMVNGGGGGGTLGVAMPASKVNFLEAKFDGTNWLFLAMGVN
jgi:hypothetical protein